jgi:trehalose/maltose hydrolase-like predicted phosphorylase
MWLQWIITKDQEFLENVAFPVCYESMIYLGQRIHQEDDGKWHFRYILPADEFAVGGVHDNAFTNLYLDKCMRIVMQWCEKLGKKYPEHWNDIIGNMKYHFDKENKRIIEHEEYAAEMIKQADVDLLTWPLETPLLYQPGGEEIRRNNMLFYYSRLPPNHIMMGACIFSIIAAELKMLDKSWEYFADQFPHFHPNQSYIPSESPNNNCWPFITGIGGFLANLIYGFGGIRLREDGLMFDPILPPQIPEIKCKRLTFQGCNFEYQVFDGGNRFSLENLGADCNFTIYSRKDQRFLPEGISNIEIVDMPERGEIKYICILNSKKPQIFLKK